MKKKFFIRFSLVLYFSIVGTVFSYGTVYEAENATYGGGATVSADANASGGSFLGNFNGEGDYVQFAITGATAGNQDVLIRSTTGIAGSLNLYVNGTLIGPVEIPTTGGWSNFKDYAVNVTLNAGSNTIKFQHDATNSGYYYIDCLTVTGISTVASVSIAPQTLNITDVSGSQLTATVLPADVQNKAVTWTSSNTAVATVDASGYVRGKSAGNTTITATTVDGNKTATCEVVVTASNATKYEAELATLSGLSLWADWPDYSGTGFVAAFGNEGDNVQFSVTATTAGSYNVVLSFSTGTGISLDLYVNDLKIKQIDLPNTGGWGNWTYHLDNVTLNAGNNTIKYQKGSGGGYLNADYIALIGIDNAPLTFNKETGTAYRWWGNAVSTSNDNGVLAPGLNDGNTTVDVALAGGGEEPQPTSGAGWYEAAGLVFSAAKTITKVEFVNGTFAGQVNGVWDDGCFEVDFKLQTTVDGTTWTDATGWTVSPDYAYLNTSVSGATFTFTGSANNVLGIRVTGKVRTSETTGSWEERVREITAYSGSTVTEVPGGVKKSDISLFPNPLSSGSLSIKLPEGAMQLSIFDITGKIVYQKQVTKNEYLIDQSVFESEGVYIVNVMTSNNSINKKVIVTK